MKNPALPAVLLGLFLVNCVSRAQSTIDPVDAFAWASNVGWTNWRPSLADGAVIGEYVCSGSVFCANIGWVNMGSGTPANGIRYGNAAAGDYGVNFMPGRSASGAPTRHSTGATFSPLHQLSVCTPRGGKSTLAVRH